MIELSIKNGVVSDKIHFEDDMDDEAKTLEFVLAFHLLVNTFAEMTHKSYDTAKMNLLTHAAFTEKEVLSQLRETEEKE